MALAARATTEEIAEQIAERGEDVLDGRKARTRATARALDAVEAGAVVHRASVYVGQHLVRVRRFFEFLLGVFVAAALVGMKLLGEPPVGFFQVGLARATLDPEYFIKITHDRGESMPWVMRGTWDVKVWSAHGQPLRSRALRAGRG